MSILIDNATVINDPLSGSFTTGQSVAVDGTDIQAIGSAPELRQAFPGAERIDGTGCFLLPGLIDAHTHLYAALTTGMPAPAQSPHNFPEILQRVWWRWDKALQDEDVYLSAVVGSIASIRSGITTILDHHASPRAVPGSLSRVADGVKQVGVRACLAYEVSDRDGPESRDQGIAENIRFSQEVSKRPDNLFKSLFGIHAVFTVSDETLSKCAEAAADLQIGCHMHVAEHKTEVLPFVQSHGKSIVEYLAEVGLLGPGTLLAHTVHLDRSDIERLVSTGTFNVHNPKSNMGNGVGIAPLIEMLELGQPVGIGSDGFYDIPQEIVTAKLLQTCARGDPSAFSDSLALRLAFDHNVRFADRIFGARLGKIAPQYAADLVLTTYEPSTLVLPDNLTSHVLAAINGGGVKTVLVNGRIVMKDGAILGIDEAEVTRKANVSASQVWSRL